MGKSGILRLTEKEMEVLRVLWTEEKALVASEIVKAHPALNINTVQAALRSLLGKGLIQVADIVYSGTVLSRSYQPTYSEEELMIGNFVEEIKNLGKRVPTPRIVAAFLEQEKDKEAVIAELEKMLAQKKKELKKGDS